MRDNAQRSRNIKLYLPWWWQVLESSSNDTRLSPVETESMFPAHILVKFASSAQPLGAPPGPRACSPAPFSVAYYWRMCKWLTSIFSNWLRVSLLQIHYVCTLLPCSGKTTPFPKYQIRVITHSYMQFYHITFPNNAFQNYHHPSGYRSETLRLWQVVCSF